MEFIEEFHEKWLSFSGRELTKTHEILYESKKCIQ